MYRFSGNRPPITQIQNDKVITAIASGISCPGWLDSGIKMKEQHYKLLTNGVTCQDSSFYTWNLLSKTETKHYCVYGMKNAWISVKTNNLYMRMTQHRRTKPSRQVSDVHLHSFFNCLSHWENPSLMVCIGHGQVVLPQDNNCNVMKSGLNICCYSINVLLIYSSNVTSSPTNNYRKKSQKLGR